MPNRTIKEMFRKGHTGSSNTKTLAINTTGIDTGDTVTIKTGLIGCVIDNIKVKAPALGSSTSIRVGHTQISGTTDDDSIQANYSTTAATSKEWIGIIDTGSQNSYDLTMKFTGNTTDNKTVFIQVGYTSYL